MLKTVSAVSRLASVEVGDKELDSKKIQVENQDEKEPSQKAVKANKRQNLKSGFKRKNWRPRELKTLVAN